MTLPLKPNGLLDYTRMSLSQVRDDLIETLADLAYNGGQDDLADALSGLEDESLSTSPMQSARPSLALVEAMEELAARQTDPRFHILAKPLLRTAADLAVAELRPRSPSAPSSARS